MKKTFTLIELMVVIAIIGILGVVITPVVGKAIEKAKIARVVSDVSAITKAARMMNIDTGMWPGSNWPVDLGDPLAGADFGEGFVFRGDDPDMPNTWDGPYLKSWSKNSWGGWYMWDYNEPDQSGDGIGQEHVLYMDRNRITSTGVVNPGQRISMAARTKIDEALDDGDLTTGMVMTAPPLWVTEDFMYIEQQGQ